MRVLSLFDGICCGMVALERAGIKVDRYVAYEIDENAIRVAKHNYPFIEEMGSVVNANFEQYKGFDLLIGGSPCQNMSTLGDRKGLKGEKSSLFYEYARAIKEVNPKYFLLENVANMPQNAKNTITDILGVEPIEINSSFFSAQNRKRLYWTNIKVNEINDNNVSILDVIGEEHQPIKLVPSVQKKIPLIVEKYGKIPPIFNPYNLSEIKTKCPCLTAAGECQTKSSSVFLYNGEQFSMLNANDWERIQTLPEGYTSILNTEGARKTVIGNGWTISVIEHIFKGLVE